MALAAGGGVAQEALGFGALGFGGGLEGLELGADAGGVDQPHEFFEEEGGAVEELAFAEDLAGDHVLEAVEGELLAHLGEGLDDVVDLLLVVGMGEEVVLLAVDGVVEGLEGGGGEGVGDDDDDVEVGAADHAAGAFFRAGDAVGHLVGDVAGDHEGGVAQEEGFVGEAGEGHAEAFAGEVELFAGDGGGLLFEGSGARGEGGLLAGKTDERVGEEFAADGGGEAGVAGDGGVEAHVAAAGAVQDEPGGMAGAPEREDVGEAAGGGEFGAGERAVACQDVRDGLHGGSMALGREDGEDILREGCRLFRGRA